MNTYTHEFDYVYKGDNYVCMPDKYVSMEDNFVQLYTTLKIIIYTWSNGILRRG